ncbi:SusE domain-containing protein [Nonlabens agnitus]|uniref:SusE outer membrane protein domain-containing protein n=1 Tax=Nonlabens agnitus TaxID=870484 RepID=A0A2S9WVC3_9FLAO|nr:SusE domain-containing protein [Nonlabens agnitus]PRP67391.1 hypothetical protein BST86_09950 [Nonlabens agnitus]
MKKIYSLLMGLTVIAGVIAGCSDNDEELFLNTNSDAQLKLSPSSGTFVVTETNQDQLAERFNWDDVEGNVPVAINYTVQMDVIDGDYSAPFVLAQSPGVDAPITYGKLNDAALSLGGENGTAASYKARVIGTTADVTMEPIVSEDVSITITPFVGYPFDPLYFVGESSPLREWNNGDSNSGINPPLFINPDDANVYSFTGRFAAGSGFKILPQVGAWQPQYGSRGAANPITLNEGGDEPQPFTVPSDGYYTLTIDISGVTGTSTGDGSYSLEPASNAASAPTYTSIGMLGSSFSNAPFDTSEDINMELFVPQGQSNFDPHLWVARSVVVGSGEMKFRANDSWDNNWGSDTIYTGKGSMGGPNVPTSAGTYDIFFSDLDGSYLFIPVEE